MIAGNRKWSDALAVTGQQYAYSFDTIGNRTGTATNGRAASYGADAGNRLTTRDVPGAVDVLGTASPLATVTVNGASAARHGDYFYKELPVTNSSTPTEALPSIAATRTSGTTTRTGRVFVPKTPEAFSYDFDGNLTGDGRFTYTWDAENRLIGMETLASVPVGSRVKLAFAYDARHRRIRKQVWRWTAGAWVLHHTIRYAYDGWNLVAELGDAGQPLRTYVWGLDLSGALQGAGGVGGLLLVQDATEGKTFPAAYDLNGNVIALVDQAIGGAVAQYEYGPFGELIRASGQYAQVNPFRFSTKYQDEETGLLMYQLRPYQPTTGRWLGRDPIGEIGGLNLYGIVGNNLVNAIDPLGLREISFAFDAFINGSRGDWLDEPFNPFSQFKTDGRGFGQFNRSAQNARVFSYGSIESTKIGSAANGGANGSSDTGYSHRRSRLFPTNMFNIISMQYGAIWGPVRTEKAPISNAAPKIKDVGPCKTTITFKPSASYPFLPSPDINYDVTFTFEVVGKDKVKVTVEGSHNRFPDYESYVDGPLIYQWVSPSSGPGIINLGVTWRNIPKTEKVINAPTP